ncbi:MAG TPA: hypothetical protein VKH18_02920, partial [Terriglobales bacterium]|nr:hypothetical protein [Terriglobales bacterium]
MGGVTKPAVVEFVAFWGHAYSAHGELVLRRRFETLEMSVTSSRGVRDELRSAVPLKTPDPFSSLRVCTPAIMLRSVMKFCGHS